MSKKVIALLPMKHHSERVKSKNFRDFCGKPLFFWTLEQLLQSRYINEVIINTDSDEIERLSSSWKNVTIHKRPEELCGDFVSMNKIIGYDLDHSDGDVYLQTHSTNPLLTAQTIDCAIETYIAEKMFDSLFSVISHQSRFYFHNLTPVNHDPSNLIRTQDLPVLHEENSCIYIFSKSSFGKKEQRIGEKPFLFTMDKIESVDIDNEIDFVIAEAIMKHRVEKIR